MSYDEDCQGVFCKECNKAGKSLQRTGGTWVTKPFTNWKKALEKIKAHSQSDIHVQVCQASMLAERAAREGTIMQQLQQITDEEKMKNRAAVEVLIHCPHFLTRQHIAHSINFEKLVSLVVACGGEDLKTFLESACRNAMYTSRIAVTEFIKALGTWVEQSLLKHLHQAPFYSIMADKCTDVSTVEELSLFCRWLENCEPTEHFIDLLPMKRTDAESICSALVECLKSKNIQLSNLIGMGFDSAATFSGKKSGIQARMKKHSPHALFVHCHCHQLQLACVQTLFDSDLEVVTIWNKKVEELQFKLLACSQSLYMYIYVLLYYYYICTMVLL